MDMNIKAILPNYYKSTTLFLASNILERTVYYGLRSLLVLYMIGETLQMSREEAYSIYGIFVSIMLLTKVFGGVLGDLIIGNRLASIVGVGLQALGAFVFCIPSILMLYIGIGLISLGSGLYAPNLFSQFGKLQLKNEAKMDSGFTLLSLTINLGAFLGMLFLGFLGEKNFLYGFSAAGILALLSVVILLFTKNNPPNSIDDSKKISLQKRVFMGLAAIFISSFFWWVYELGSSGLFLTIMSDLRDTLGDSIPVSLLHSFNSYAFILLGIAGAVIWWFWRLNRFIKLGVGCIAGGLSFAVLLLMPEGGQTPGLIVFIVSVFLLGLAEVLISPTIYSLLTKYTRPKYLAIVFSIAFLPTSFLYLLNSLLIEHSFDTLDSNFLLKLSSSLLVTAGIAVIVLGFIFLKKKPTL
ncbi:MAG: MFS transporter [Flavobacteriaceae bacterium]|nr:MFS transporter [Flavobacteriaceae bacterium]